MQKELLELLGFTNVLLFLDDGWNIIHGAIVVQTERNQPIKIVFIIKKEIMSLGSLSDGFVNLLDVSLVVKDVLHDIEESILIGSHELVAIQTSSHKVRNVIIDDVVKVQMLRGNC